VFCSASAFSAQLLIKLDAAGNVIIDNIFVARGDEVIEQERRCPPLAHLARRALIRARRNTASIDV
jgi:hypothetical protein